MDNILEFANNSAQDHHVMNVWAYLKKDNPFGFSAYEVALSKNGARYIRKNETQSILNEMQLFKKPEERNAYVEEFMNTHDVKPVEGVSGIYEYTKDGKKALIRINDNINFNINNMYITQNIHKTGQMMLRLLRDEVNTPKMKDQFISEVKQLREQLQSADMDDALDFRVDDTLNQLDKIEDIILGTSKKLTQKTIRSTVKRKMRNNLGEAQDNIHNLRSDMSIKGSANNLESVGASIDDRAAMIGNVKDVFKYILQPKSKPYFRNKGTNGWQPKTTKETIKMWDAGIEDQAHFISNRYLSNRVRSTIEDQLIMANEAGYRGEYQDWLHTTLDNLNNAKPFDKQYLDESIPPNVLKTIQNIDAIGTAGVLVGNVHAGIVNNVIAGLS